MKLQKQQIRKIDISQINITDNIRKQYDNIKSLARSIERDGQLQPIGVIEQKDGTFNMLYGFRRYHAHLFLINEGKGFNQIEAKITTGDPTIIQLIENIHRKDLKPEEFENALQALINSGLSQKEISERLNIRLTRISDALAAKKTRDKMEEIDIDTSGLSTSAISLLRSVPEKEQKEVIKEVKKKGGTVKAAREIIKEKQSTWICPICKEKNDKKNQYCKNNCEQRLKRAKRKPPNHEVSIRQFGYRNQRNPCWCTKQELCEKQTGCKICSFNINNQSGKEEKAFTQMSLKDFLKLPEIIAIVDAKKIILQDKCEYCGKEW